jgi:hypothetical protein
MNLFAVKLQQRNDLMKDCELPFVTMVMPLPSDTVAMFLTRRGLQKTLTIQQVSSKIQFGSITSISF